MLRQNIQFSGLLMVLCLISCIIALPGCQNKQNKKAFQARQIQASSSASMQALEQQIHTVMLRLEELERSLRELRQERWTAIQPDSRDRPATTAFLPPKVTANTPVESIAAVPRPKLQPPAASDGRGSNNRGGLEHLVNRYLNGVILEVRRSPDRATAEVNFGARDGVREGWEFGIYDNGEQVARLRIVSVDIARCVGVIVDESSNTSLVRVGLRVVGKKSDQ